jgi:DNA-binding transcriptional MerR regulator
MPKARIQKRLYYKIGEACKALDIQPYVLRYWETEFPAISPNKSRSGQRVYSEKELEIIRRIKELLYDEGYTIAGAKKKLEGELASGSLARFEEPERDPPEPDDEVDEAPAAAEAEPPRDRRAAAAAPAAANVAAAGTAGAEPAAGPRQVPLELGDQLDTRAGERIQSLRSGVQRALAEAREILALLSPPNDP